MDAAGIADSVLEVSTSSPLSEMLGRGRWARSAITL